VKEFTISRRDAKAQRFEVNDGFISLVAPAPVREMLLFESEFILNLFSLLTRLFSLTFSPFSPHDSQGRGLTTSRAYGVGSVSLTY
jgi:hypothetical protein